MRSGFGGGFEVFEVGEPEKHGGGVAFLDGVLGEVSDDVAAECVGGRAGVAEGTGGG